MSRDTNGISGQVTKCTFNKFGPTGPLMRRDALCVLPVNIINEVRNYEINSKLVCEDSTITRRPYYVLGPSFLSLKLK